MTDDILSIVHDAFLEALPWSSFRPHLSALELMSRLVDSYLPSCHTFLGRIFLEVPWPYVLANLRKDETVEQFLPILLKLIVKLSAEPAMRQVSLFKIL